MNKQKHTNNKHPERIFQLAFDLTQTFTHSLTIIPPLNKHKKTAATKPKYVQCTYLGVFVFVVNRLTNYKTVYFLCDVHGCRWQYCLISNLRIFDRFNRILFIYVLHWMRRFFFLFHSFSFDFSSTCHHFLLKYRYEIERKNQFDVSDKMRLDQKLKKPKLQLNLLFSFWICSPTNTQLLTPTYLHSLCDCDNNIERPIYVV